MNPESLILIAATVPLVGVVAIALSSVLLRDSAGHRRAGAASFAAFLTAAAGLILRGEYPFELRTLPTPIGMIDPGFGPLLIDPLSTTWILLATWLTGCLLCFEFDAARIRNSSELRSCRRVICGLFLIATTSWAALTMDVWQQWGAVSLSGWLLCGLLSSDDGESSQPHVSPLLLWLLCADLCWLVGAAVLQGILGPWDLRTLSIWPAHLELNAGEWSLGAVAAGVMFFGLGIRLGLFPVQLSTAAANESGRHAAWIALFGYGSGVMLLSRWAPVLTPFAEFRTLLLGLGGMSAVLLGVRAWAKAESHERCLSLAGGQLGLVAMGIAAVPADEFPFTLMGLLALGTISLSAVSLSNSGASPRLSWVAAILLCGGAFGQEGVFDAVQTMAVEEGRNPWPLLGTGLFGHGLICFALFRLLQARPDQWTDGGGSRPIVNVAQGASLAVLTAAAVLPTWLGGRTPDGTPFDPRGNLGIPVATPLVMLIALTAARLFPVSTSGTETEPRAASLKASFLRLGREDFYLPLLLRSFVTAPTEAAAAAWRRLHDLTGRSFADWMIRQSRSWADQAEEVDAETSPLQMAGIMLTTALALALAILIGRGGD